MSDVINLRMARKRRERSEARAQADENAVRHGLSKAERRKLAAEREKSEAHLDRHKREIED